MRTPCRWVLVAALFVAAFPAAGERNVAEWFGGKDGAAYGAVEPAIEQAAEMARAAGVPEELLVERLAEGAAKAVAPEVLRRAVQEDAATLAALAASLDRWMPRLDAAARTEALRLGAVAGRAGITTGSMDAAIAWAVEDRRDLGRTMAALVAVAALRRGLALDEARSLALAKAFVRSGEPTSRFAAFVSLLTGARARGLSVDTVVDAALSALADGRTFLFLQRELDRRSKR